MGIILEYWEDETTHGIAKDHFLAISSLHCIPLTLNVFPLMSGTDREVERESEPKTERHLYHCPTASEACPLWVGTIDFKSASSRVVTCMFYQVLSATA